MRKLFCGILLVLFSCDFTPPLLEEIGEAQQLILQRRYHEAIIKYEKALEKNLPKEIRIRIYYQLGDLYSIYLAQNEKGIEYYKKIKKSFPDPLWIIKTEERMGEIQFSFLKDYRESYKHYHQLASFTPQLEKHDFYELRRALSSFNLNQLETATRHFKEILSKKQHKYRILSMYYLGLISFQREKWKSAIGYWKEYIKLEKSKDDIIQTKFLMANAYETMEDLKRAYNLYYSILGEYPNVEVVKNRLKSIYDRRVARKR